MLRIADGAVYDPRNGVRGEVRDVWIDGGRVVAAPGDPETRPDRTIDAEGMVVIPVASIFTAISPGRKSTRPAR